MPKIKKCKGIGLCGLLTALFVLPLAQGHSMYQSAVLLDFRGNVVDAELQLPLDRLAISFKQTVDEQHFAAQQGLLRAYLQAHIQPVTPDQVPFRVTPGSLSIQQVEGAPYLVARLTLAPPPGHGPDRFLLHYDAITHEIVTHVALVSIRSDSKTEIKEPLLIGVIRGERKTVNVERPALLGVKR